MTYDPEKLRNLLLGVRSSEDTDKSEDESSTEKEHSSTPSDAGSTLEEPKRTPKGEEALYSSQKDRHQQTDEEKNTGKQVKEKQSRPKKDPGSQKPLKRKPVLPPSPLSWLTLCGGALSLFASVISLAFDKNGSAPIMLAGIGIVLLGGFAIVNKRWLRLILSTRSVRYSANVATVIASFGGILLLLNIIAYQYYYRLDLSAERIHTLSPQSLQILADIDRAGEKVYVTAFVAASDITRKAIDDLMDLYRYHSRNIEFSFVDPEIKKELTESKGINRVPSVLFELGDRRSVITDIDEQNFTKALIAVRETSSRTVAFLTGHGEPSPDTGDENQTGLSILKKHLELDNFHVTSIRLPESRQVPPETTVLMIVAPQRELDQKEIEAIENYLDNGGRVIVLTEPGKTAGLSGTLAKYGIAANKDLVLDDKENYFGNNSNIRVTGNPDNPITKSLSEGMLFLNAGSLSLSTTSRLSSVETESVVRSSVNSWSEPIEQSLSQEGMEKREAREMAFLSTRKLIDSSNDETKPEGQKIARLLVINDSSFVLNANIEKFYNLDFILNSVNYLAESEQLMSIRAAGQTSRQLNLNPIQRGLIFAFSVVLTPLFVAGLGVWVWYKRK